MKKDELIKLSKQFYPSLTKYEELFLIRMDALIEILTDIRNNMNNGKDE
jgi:hypothetical protein